MKYAFAALVLAALLPLRQATPIVATAGPPVLNEDGPAATWFLMNERDYTTFVEQRGHENANFVPIRRKPANLSPRAHYGLNLIVGGRNLCWIADGSLEDGFTLYADWNANGDLSDDAPLTMKKVNGKYTVHVDTPIAVTLVLDMVEPPAGPPAKLAMKRYDRSTRSGTLAMPDGRTVAFRLLGSAGAYAEDYNTVSFDLDGDGAFDAQTEVFRVSEGHVNIGGTSYGFSVEPTGRTLTLTPLAEHLPPRVVLTAGAIAPDFTFTDLDGKTHKLSDYRGKVVLLDFWGTWCAPCVAEAPRLVAAYDKFHDRGFEIIGLNTLDTPDKVRAFIGEHRFSWVQTIESDKGPLQTLYRINGWPSYLLLDRDGRIVRARFGSGEDIESLVRTVM
jgi:peroxiredoxin